MPVAIAPEEHTQAVLTHLSGLAGYLVPFAGIFVPLIILWVKQDSRVITSIAKQAVFLNLSVFAAIVIGIILCFTIVLIPFVIVAGFGMCVAVIALPIVGAI